MTPDIRVLCAQGVIVTGPQRNTRDLTEQNIWKRFFGDESKAPTILPFRPRQVPLKREGRWLEEGAVEGPESGVMWLSPAGMRHAGASVDRGRGALRGPDTSGAIPQE